MTLKPNTQLNASIMKTLITVILTSLFSLAFISCSSEKPTIAEHRSHDHGEGVHTHAGKSLDHAPTASHDSDHPKKQAGPNGGRVVASVEPRLEFFVTDNGYVQISFLDEAGNIIAPTDQQVSLIGGDRSNPTSLSFERNGDVLVSNAALPLENIIPIILQVLASPGNEPIREKFNLNMSTCPECDYKEYACICGHEEKEHDGSAHSH